MIKKPLALTHLLVTNITMNIPFSEGGLIVCVWEINEGDPIFPYSMNSMPPKYLGFWDSKVSTCQELSVQALFHFLSVRRCLRVESCRLKRTPNIM